MEVIMQIYALSDVEKYFIDYDWCSRVEIITNIISKIAKRVSSEGCKEVEVSKEECSELITLPTRTFSLQLTNGSILLVSNECIYAVLEVFDTIEMTNTLKYFKFYEKKICYFLPYNGRSCWELK